MEEIEQNAFNLNPDTNHDSDDMDITYSHNSHSYGNHCIIFTLNIN